MIIDEAQTLAAGALEELRMLPSFKTENQAFLQIMLVGEPEIIDKIKNSNIRQLPQRIAVHYSLTGLDPKETGKYISFRLQQAGGPPDLFTADAVDNIYRITRGIPRLINLLCQAALVYGYAVATRKIENKIIEQIARDKICFGLEPQFEDSAAVARTDSNKEDEILRRLGVLEEKINNALQGYSPSQPQQNEYSTGNFQDNLISKLLQIFIDERRNSEELMWRYSERSLNSENLKRSAKALQNEKGSKQDETGAAQYISFNQKKRSRFSD